MAHRTIGRTLVVVVGSLVALTAVIATSQMLGAQDSGVSRCNEFDEFDPSDLEPVRYPASPSGEALVADPVALTYKAAPIELNFGRGRDAEWDSEDITLRGRPQVEGVLVGVQVGRRPELQGSNTSEFINADNIQAVARFEGERVSVSVCVDPMRPRSTDSAGRYEGDLTISSSTSDPFQETTIPIAVTLQAQDRVFPTLVFLATVAGAAGFQFMVSGAFTQSTAKQPTRVLRVPPKTIEYAFGAVAGLLAAIPAVYFAEFENNPAWTGDLQELFRFGGVTAAATAAAYPTGAMIARTLIDQKARQESRDRDSADPLPVGQQE